MTVIPYHSLYELVQATLRAWQSNHSPNVQQFVGEHPSIRDEKSLLLDLIYEEYCQDREAARQPRVTQYLREFPEYQESIGRLIEVHSVLNETPTKRNPSPCWPAVGELHCGHEILALLGRGAFSRVYLARQIELGNRLVVTKFTASFSDEANLLGPMGHPAIMPVYSVQQQAEQGLTLIVMPFRGVSTLLDILDRCRNLAVVPQYAGDIVRPVSRPTGSLLAHLFPAENDELPLPASDSYFDWVLSVGRTLAEALEYVHARGIWHRDIKPSNILLSWNGRPLLMDFNLAQTRDARVQHEGGTLAYMPPERLWSFGEPQPETAANREAEDLFALGVVLYELLLGRHSVGFRSEWDLDDQLRQLLAPDRFQDWPSGIEPRTVQVISRCLATAPESRGTARQLKQDLASSLSKFSRSRRYARSHPRRVFLGSMGLLSGLVAGGTYFWLQPPKHIRLYENGLTRYQQENYQGAVGLFAEALQFGELEPEIFFARGQANRLDQKFVTAGEDFESALLRAQGALPSIVRECRAYCHLRLGNMGLASEIYESLLASHVVPIRIKNNLAYCLNQVGNQQGGYSVLDMNIPESAEYAVAFHNRARLQLAIAVKGKQAVPIAAWRDIQTALRLGRNNALVHLEAAAIVLASSSSSESFEVAIGHLEKAVDIGYPGKNLMNDLRYARIQGHSGFKALAGRPMGSQTVQRELDLSTPPPAGARLSEYPRD